jgi:hypothetical protein
MKRLSAKRRAFYGGLTVFQDGGVFTDEELAAGLTNAPRNVSDLRIDLLRCVSDPCGCAYLLLGKQE